MIACDTASDGPSFYILRHMKVVAIRHFTMSTPPVLKGTKRSYDELVHIMDSWLKQEVDALSKKILLVQAENKRLKHRNQLLEMHRAQSNIVVRELREESEFRQAIIHEIFTNHPEVHNEYVHTLEAVEVLEGETTESETEWEEEELERGEST
jgi:hypothetical protein